MWHIGSKSPKFETYHLLYSFVAQGLGTTKFTNLVAEINVENGPDFPIYYKHLKTSMFCSGKAANKMQDHWLSSNNINLSKCQKVWR